MPVALLSNKRFDDFNNLLLLSFWKSRYGFKSTSCLADRPAALPFLVAVAVEMFYRHFENLCELLHLVRP